LFCHEDTKAQSLFKKNRLKIARKVAESQSFFAKDFKLKKENLGDFASLRD